MRQSANEERREAFARWLRTGRLPRIAGPDGIECKFNPWHDPMDGRFTFSGAGRSLGVAGDKADHKLTDRTSRQLVRAEPRKVQISAKLHQKAPVPKKPVNVGSQTEDLIAPDLRLGSTALRRSDPPNPALEFVGGVGEGLYDVAEGTVAGVYSVLTTNPVTTSQNVAIGAAETIDAVIRADATPARIHIARAVDAVAHASAHDLGRATGLVAGNVALAAAPGAALSKVSALLPLRAVMSETIYKPPQIHWVKENLTSTKPWRTYNDAATGARPGHAPALTRTMPDGSKRPVKFDGIQGDYVIDRKWSVRDMPRARAQLLRQSDVLAQHRLIGLWEVPTPAVRIKALKLLKKMRVTNIRVRIVKP